jgi:hypothetical protein
MSILADELATVAAQSVQVSDASLSVTLSDGRTLTVPLDWFPRLLAGSEKERRTWRLIGEGEGIHWPDLDEDISVRNLLLGRRSGESQSSFQRWLGQRPKAKQRE